MKKITPKQNKGEPLTIAGITKVVKNIVSKSQEELAIMVKGGFDAVDHKFDHIDKRFDDMESRFNQKIDGLSNRIDDLSLNRATREQFVILDKRVSRLEEHLKIAPKISGDK